MNCRKGGLQMLLHFIPIHVFRETPQVSFLDAGVNGSNGAGCRRKWIKWR